ncbi:MAG: polymer-forming cytoskeletal protein [Curvibacter sp.]
MKMFIKPPKVDGYLPAGVRLVGDLAFGSSLWIDAALEGNISATRNSASLLVVGPEGNITGDIDADDVIVYGCIKGTIVARNSLAVAATARIHGGELVCGKLAIETGAQVVSEMREHSATSARARPFELVGRTGTTAR